MRRETFGEGHGRAVARPGMAGSGEFEGSGRPAVICLAATEQDRRDIEAILGAGTAGEAVATDLTSLGTLTEAGGTRRAILAGPDASAAILTGRRTDGGATTSSSIVDVWPLPSRLLAGGGTFDGAPPVPGGVAGTGGAMGAASAPAISPRTGARIPSGPLVHLCSEHDRTVLAGLTRREAEVAELVGKGLNVGEIAAALGREKTTVISHRRSLLRKIGCRDALGIARFAYRTGLAEA